MLGGDLAALDLILKVVTSDAVKSLMVLSVAIAVILFTHPDLEVKQ